MGCKLRRSASAAVTCLLVLTLAGMAGAASEETQVRDAGFADDAPAPRAKDPDASELSLDMDEMMLSLNLTLARVNARFERKLQELERLRMDSSLAGKLKSDAAQRKSDIREHEDEIAALKAGYIATQAQFESLKSEALRLQTKAVTPDKLAKELRLMQIRFQALQNSIEDKDITRRLAESVADIGRVLESDALAATLSEGVQGAVEAALGAEGLIEKTLDTQISHFTSKSTSKLLAFTLSWLLLAVPLWLTTLGMQRISGYFSARQHVLLCVSVHAVMALICLLAWCVLQRDPLAIIKRSSRNNLVVVMFVLLLQCPVVIVLCLRAIAVSASNRERGLLLVCFAAYVANAILFRARLWRPLMVKSVESSPHAVGETPAVYFFAFLLSLIASYSALKARPPAVREELAQDITRVVNELEAVSTGEKLA
eukprot:CAMPEP_0185841184 /NCGR_PEP_ID=MMETSP1353-20130828/17473_1 /TAXON_ID=1077150 /ORGANISM="Erythrolobus australicus, Strain CCMP3124" /LENGTH=427 /DNA_ID=CAMNT_0028540603 /DNA_START=29 /DNA_END=1312 /DNA_ORIENTATION=+